MSSILSTSLQTVVPRAEARHYHVLAVLHPRVEEARVERFPWVIGRAPESDLILDDASVSRHHARISSEEGALLLTDLDSKNGCSVNRIRVQGVAALRLGDVLRLGEFVLRLVRRPLETEAPPLDSVLVGGPSLNEVRRLLLLLSPTPIRLLLSGESGTGKELLAGEVHRHSGRAGPFVALNCAALPEHLVESELFGHEKGAFTGAHREKPGLFEAARGGTLFLDEVTELPAGAQAKLLRAVETGEVRRLGAVSVVRTDCRIICATNRDLAAEVREGRMRADLAARLAEAEIHLPSLAERVEDLPLLVRHLGRRAGEPLRLDADVVEILACYRWPLNVRELDNLVRTVSVLARGEVVRPVHLPPAIAALPLRQGAGTPRGQPAAGAGTADDGPLTIARVIEVLRANGGNIRRTSQELGVSRPFLYRCLDRAGLSPRDLRSGTRRA